MKVLRHYQLAAVDQASAAFRSGKKRVVVCAPTGSGKSAMGMEMIRRALDRGRRCIFIADRNLLIKQFSREASAWGIWHGTITRNGFSDHDAPFQIASKDTFLNYYLKKKRAEVPKFDLVVGDEIHRALVKTWRDVLGSLSSAYQVGLTATPIRPNGKALSPEFEHLVMPVYPSELLAEGFLVPTRCFSPTFPDLKDVRKDENGDYRKEDLNKVMNRHNMIGDVYTWWKRLGEDRSTITYGVGIDHCLAMRDEFLRNGVKAVHVNGHSEEGELEDAFEGFKAGKYKVLVSADLVTEGADLPICSCIQIVRPTKSLRLALQIYGRGLRPHPESSKVDTVVIDHSGVVLYHGLPNQDIEWSLDPDAERIEKKREKEREEGKLPTPIVCPKCFFMYQGLPACPSCGHKPQRKAKALRTRAGVLVRVDKSLDGKPKPGVDYNRIWTQCLAIAANKGRNFSMAAAVFKSKTGVPPWAVNVGPMPPDDGTGSGRCNWQANVAETYPNFVRKRQEIPA